MDTLVCDSQLTLRGAQRALEKPEYGLLPVLTTQEHDLLHNSIDFYRRQQDVMQTYDASESSIRKKGHVHGLRGVVLQFVERLYTRDGEDADDDVAGDEMDTVAMDKKKNERDACDKKWNSSNGHRYRRIPKGAGVRARNVHME